MRFVRGDYSAMSDRTRSRPLTLFKGVAILSVVTVLFWLIITPERPLFGSSVHGSFGFEFRPFPPIHDSHGAWLFFDFERNVIAVVHIPAESAEIGLMDMIHWTSNSATLFPNTGYPATIPADCRSILIVFALNNAKLEINLKTNSVRNWFQENDLPRRARNPEEEGGVGVLNAIDELLTVESRQALRDFRRANEI